MKKEVIGTTEACKKLGVARVTLYRWARDGLIPCFKATNKGKGRPYSWRFRVSDIDRWVKKRIKKK